MTDIECPEEGTEIDPAWMCTVVTIVNDIVNELAALLCDTAAADVASTAAAGTSEAASRCDHAHKGVFRNIAGDGISVNNEYGSVTISADTGPGGVFEGDYSSYATKSTIAADSNIYNIKRVHAWALDETVFLYADGGNDLQLVNISAGTITDTTKDVSNPGEHSYHTQSKFGKYAVFTERTSQKELYIYKDGVLLQTLETDDTSNDSVFYLVMSPSGKYIICSYWDGSEAGDARYKIRIYEGSE